MTTDTAIARQVAELKKYEAGFVTDIETDKAPKGLSEDIIRFISRKKNEPEFMLEWRLKAYHHWMTMPEPHWPNFFYEPIDYQAICYYSAPKNKDEKNPSFLAIIFSNFTRYF
jgi:Fe-S cluster assembly protein SufB